MESGDDGRSFDAIVIGAGIMGSCAAYELSKRGQRVLLLDQFDFLHQLGSSHGESRTIRATYVKPFYASMVIHSFNLWEQAQIESGLRVLTRTPHLDLGPASHPIMLSILHTCKSNSITFKIFHDANDLRQAFSGAFDLPDGWIAISTELGGVIKPTKAVAMFQALALQRGAVLCDRFRVETITKDNNQRGGVWVAAADSGERFWGRKCVVTAGAWTRKLASSIGGVELPIEPLHLTLCYWKIKEGSEGKLSLESGFPAFASHSEDSIYGTPSLEYPGLIKVALNDGPPCDPDRREWVPGSQESVKRWIERVASRCIEADGGPAMTQCCMYSMTSDKDFVIDFLGGGFGEDVVVAGGFSGHGFKMGPLVGKIVSDLAVDGVAVGVDLTPFSISRFDVGESKPTGT